MSHTPGPWKYDPGANDAGAIRAADATRPSRWSGVASVHFRETHGEFEANARLIAAAPEMLELLAKLTAAIGSKDMPAVTHRVCEDALPLLARISGGDAE